MPEKRFTLGILECGRPPDQLAGFGSYTSMVSKWLGFDGIVETNFAVLDGEMPSSPNDADFWVITGSRFGAYDALPWIEPLEQFIRDCRSNSVPMLGICFGHQIIAQALGGVVRKSDKGWGIGIHDYEVSRWPQELGTAPGELRLQAYHQDQVEIPPVGADVIASSDFCEFAALWYPGFAVTFQGHPEFAHDYATELIKLRSGTTFDTSLGDRAIGTQTKATNRESLSELLRGWITGNEGVKNK